MSCEVSLTSCGEDASLALVGHSSSDSVALKISSFSEDRVMPVYPIKWQRCPHVETSQLICYAKQLIGFYMRVTLALNGLNIKYQFDDWERTVLLSQAG